MPKLKLDPSKSNQYGFIPHKLFIKDRPELKVFPFNIMFMSWSKIDGVDTSGTSLYEPDISSYSNGDNAQSMYYYNKYCDDDYIDIKYFSTGGRYEGEKYVKHRHVVSADGANWKGFFIHLTLAGLDKDEDCELDKHDSENSTVMDNDIKQFLRIVTSGQEAKITSSYTTKELVNAIEHLSDDEMNALLRQRPGHPEMRGFIVNPRILQEQTADVVFALSQRQAKLK